MDFEIQGHRYALPDELATLLAENLLRLGSYDDVDPTDAKQMQELARKIEHVLVDPHADPIRPTPDELVLLLDRVDTLTASADESALTLFRAIQRGLRSR